MAYPVALAMGMTPAQFWDGSPWDFAAYREARRMEDERGAWERWDIGLYVYEAICKTYGLLNPFVKRHEADPWEKRPHGVDGEKYRELDKKADHKAFGDFLLRHGPAG